MAVNVDTVYKTVLLILNKEQRGYMPPDEFNRVGTQVQLEMFEQYMSDLNQQKRVPLNDSEYANRVKNIDEKIAIFKKLSGNLTLVAGTDYFALPSDLYRLGSVIIDNAVEAELIDRNHYYLLNKSPLTKPTISFPMYLYEDNKVSVLPTPVAGTTTTAFSYIKKPTDISWASTEGGAGQLLFDSGNSTNFELHESEQPEIVLRVLAYAGVIVKDPMIIQVASQQVQQNEINEKS
jgi:hypothetical protein